MSIFITGGAGYIGSHTCVALLNAGYNIVVADNLCNSSFKTIESIKEITGQTFPFYRIDVSDEHFVDQVFSNHEIDGVIHFAGLKSIGESSKLPIKYYYNNLVSTMVLAAVCAKYKVKKIVFSSSATVYGENDLPFVETMQLKPTTTPYGETKRVSERILTDIASSDEEFAITILRYFNPIGAHESGIIGESPCGIPNNIMPYITRVAKGELERLYIFGNNYPTIDGTGVRDYIHVMDLAEGHVKAYESLKRGVQIYNIGTGKGTSVLQLLSVFEKINEIAVPYEIVDRRSGDIAECFADTSKASRELKWVPKRSVEDMCRDAWRFEQNQSV